MTTHQQGSGRCLPCTRDMHDWCAREKYLIGLSRECGCDHTSHQPPRQAQP